MIDPVIFSIFGFPITWYAVSYMLGFIIGGYRISWLSKKYSEFYVSDKSLDYMMSAIVIGVIVGGRIGHILFFDINYYIRHIAEIPMVWKGGMAFHGGLIGAIIAVYITSIHTKENIFKLFDLVALASPIGLFFGRIANFINQELCGIPTGSCFGVIFPKMMDKVPRHPTQLYEAFFEGFLLYIILNFIAEKNIKNNKYHYLSSTILFCVLYSSFRFFIEFFKEIDTEVNFIVHNSTYLSVGQWLCIATIIIAISVKKILKLRF